MYLYIYFLSKNMIFFIFEKLVRMQLKYLEKIIFLTFYLFYHKMK
jgi:hypothetical protein